MEQLVRQVEMAPARHFVAVDQHRIELRQAAGGAGHAFDRIDHQHEDAELALHDLGEARGRNVAKLEFGSEALARRHRVLEAAIAS